MADNFKLPGSSYDELVKIIKAYSTGKVGQPMSLDVLAQTIGMDKTNISRNNGFLVQLELISEGSKKTPTDIGMSLGRAYSFNMSEEIVRIWLQITESNEFLTRMLSAIKIRGGMDKNSFISHILYSSGTNSNSSSKAGANTIIDIYKNAGLVVEIDGKINMSDTLPVKVLTPDNKPIQEPVEKTIALTTFEDSSTKNIQINININIQTTGENLDEISEKLDALLKKIRE